MVEPYSQALYEVASETKKEDKYRDNLKELCQIWQENPDLVQFLKHPKVLREQKKEVLDQVVTRKYDGTFLRYIDVLNAHDVIAYMPEIYDAYVEIYYREHHIEIVKVTSASSLDATQVRELQRVLEAKLNKKVECNIKVDPTLIAGLRVQTSQFVLDNTVESRAASLKESLRAKN